MSVTKLDIRQSLFRNTPNVIGSAPNTDVDVLLGNIDQLFGELLEDRNIELSGNGNFTFSGTSLSVASGGSLVMNINQTIQGGAPEQVTLMTNAAAISFSTSGTMWWVVLNRSAWTITSATGTTMPTVDNANEEVFLIAIRLDDTTDSTERLYFRNGFTMNSGAVGKFAASSGGSGTGSKNYLSVYTASTSSGVPNIGNGNFETGSTTGWSLAHTALSGVTPTSVASPTVAFSSTSGGSAASSNLSFTAIGSGSQIAGSYSGDLASSTLSVAGDLLISSSFFIDAEDQAKLQSISFSYELASGPSIDFSGTSTNNFMVWIYDVTNAAWIQPTCVYGMIQGTGVGQVSGTFQTTANSIEYQLAIVNPTAVSSAYSLIFDDFFVGPQTVPGPSNVVAATLTLSTSASIPNVTNTLVPFSVVRVDTNAAWNNGSSEYVVPVSGVYSISGNLNYAYTSTGPYQVILKVNGTYSYYGGSPGAVQETDVSFNWQIKFEAGDKIAIYAYQGTGSTVNIYGDNSAPGLSILNIALIAANSTNANSGVVAMIASNPTSTITDGSPIANWGTTSLDSNASFDPTTGRYTVPVSGLYTINAGFSISGTIGTSDAVIILQQNGSQVYGQGVETFSGSSGIFTNFNASVQCNAGDTLNLTINYNVSSGLAWSNGGQFNYLSIIRQSGSVSPVASDTIAMSAAVTPTSSTITGSPSLMTFPSVSFDTNASYNTTTGLYIVPISGYYSVSAELLFDGTFSIGNYALVAIYINNGVTIKERYNYAGSGNSACSSSLSTSFYVNAGDTIALWGACNASGASIDTTSGVNLLDIHRI